MTSDERVIAVLTDWLEAQPDQAPAPLLNTVLIDLQTAPQRARWRAALRRISMFGSSTLRYSIVAGALAVAIVVGYGLWAGRPPSGPGARPSPAVGPTPTASSTPAAKVTPAPATTVASPLPSELQGIIPAGWTIYQSTRYGLSLAYPSDWTVDAAVRDWDLNIDAPDWTSPATENFTAPSGDVRLSVWSVPVDLSTDETWDEVGAWMLMYCEKAGGRGEFCAAMLDNAVRLCVEIRDCHPGVLIAEGGRDTQAFFTGGIYGREMVVVSIWRDPFDPSLVPYGGGRKFIEDFLAPMCVWPEAERPEPPSTCLNFGP